MTFQICVVFFLLGGVCIHFSSCHRNQHEYQEYINKYHKVSSTTEALLASVSATTEALLTSVSSTTEASLTSEDDSSEEENESSSQEIHKNKKKFNETDLQHSGVRMSSENQGIFIIRIVIIVGSIIGGICILGFIICCCPSCCRGKRPGFIIANTRDDQAIAAEYPQHTVIVQQLPPNYPQTQPPEFPPQYMQEPVQSYPSQYTQEPVQPYPPQYMQQPVQAQQAQYSPAHPQNQYSPTGPQYYNPPEAPPPYDTPSAPKY